MRTTRLAAIAVLTVLSGGAAVWAQVPRPGAVLYEGGRILDGNGGAPIENGAMLVQEGRVTAVGVRGAVQAPAGATRVDLAGKTVMPATDRSFKISFTTRA